MTADESESTEPAVDRDRPDTDAARSSGFERVDGAGTDEMSTDGDGTDGKSTGDGTDGSPTDDLPDERTGPSPGRDSGFEFDESDFVSGTDGASGTDDERLFEELFDEVDVDELDSDRLWERLADDDAGQADDDAGQTDDDAGQTDDDADGEIRAIDKHRYCHQCEYFADPSAVECEHDGTSILELADVESFRVANCPVVLEEESLEER